MKISVIFPNVLYREGPQAVTRLIQGIEAIGYHELGMFDHVLMGYPTATRGKPFYPSTMPIVEALMTLSYAAAVTSTITLGTGVLVLPQRQPALVAKQVQTLDTLSGGRVRLGVGIGWQASEFEALGENFHNRGRRLDEGVRLLRSYWGSQQIDFDGDYYRAEAMAMEPKSPQRADIPLWIGGAVPRTLERVGEYGDGWMGQFVKDASTAAKLITRIRSHAVDAGRDPAAIGLQLMLAPWQGEQDPNKFYLSQQRMLERLVELKSLGFNWTAINCVTLFQLGYRKVDDMLDYLDETFATLKPHLEP